MKDYPEYKANIAAGRGWAGKLAVKLHLTSYLKGKSKLKIPIGGVLGAGKLLLSLGVATISVVALTIYFLIALPGVKKLWLSLIPAAGGCGPSCSPTRSSAGLAASCWGTWSRR